MKSSHQQPSFLGRMRGCIGADRARTIPGVWRSDSTMDDVPERHGKKWVPAAEGKQNFKNVLPDDFDVHNPWVAE